MSSQKKVLGAIAIGATLIGSVARVAWRAAETAPALADNGMPRRPIK